MNTKLLKWCLSFDAVYISGNKEKEEEFDELEEEEAIERLTLLATKIDRDGDGKVSKDELTYWLIQSFLYVLYNFLPEL